MEEKNVQNNVELNEEQLEQTAGGSTTALGAQAQAASTWDTIICEKCGALIYYNCLYTSVKSITCKCGNVLSQQTGSWATTICENCGTAIRYCIGYSDKAITCKCGKVINV